MEIKSKILAVLRVINVILDDLRGPGWKPPEHVTNDRWSHRTGKEYDYLIKLLRKNNIEKQDYPVLKSILQTMALMTTGAVKVIRDPSTYTPAGADVWDRYFKANYHFENLLKEIGVDLLGKPTQQDYELAQKMVKTLGSSIVNEKEVLDVFSNSGIEQEFGMDKESAVDKNLQGSKTLYRGLHNLSDAAYNLATTTGEEWDLERGVSTSMMLEVAENFATEEGIGLGGKSLVFIINNPKRKGFVADKLSHFDESEVILSGRLKITKVEFPSDNPDYHPLASVYTPVYAELL